MRGEGQPKSHGRNESRPKRKQDATAVTRMQLRQETRPPNISLNDGDSRQIAKRPIDSLGPMRVAIQQCSRQGQPVKNLSPRTNGSQTWLPRWCQQLARGRRTISLAVSYSVASSHRSVPPRRRVLHAVERQREGMGEPTLRSAGEKWVALFRCSPFSGTERHASHHSSRPTDHDHSRRLACRKIAWQAARETLLLRRCSDGHLFSSTDFLS